VAVVVSRYNHGVTSKLLNGALAALAARGEPEAAVVDAPGAFELPALASRCVATGAYRGVICLGCIIKGQTRHDEHIASAVAHALAQLSVSSGVPVVFGVITAETAQQADDRSGGSKGNKGAEAAAALLDTLEAAAAIDRAIRVGSPARVARAAGPRPADKTA
jgi:6,7-dimethyl-8-ribityllumazine synthase